MANISLEQALLLVNAGGWRLRDVHLAKEVMPNTVVTSAEIVGDTLVLRNGSESVVSVNTDRLLADMMDPERPRRIAFSGPFMISQQRKKVDGGGWHEVERIGTRFLLVNMAAQTQYETEQTKKREQSEAAAKAKEEDDRRRVLEERDARRSAFLARQKEQIGDSRVFELVATSSDIRIKFDNGHELKIELDGGDTYDAWINIEGGGQKISLNNGQDPGY